MPVEPKCGLAKGIPPGKAPVGENMPKDDDGEKGPMLCGFGRNGVEGPGENVEGGENILLGGMIGDPTGEDEDP